MSESEKDMKKFSELSVRDKKIAKIFMSFFAVVLLVVAGATIFITSTDKGQQIQDNFATEFQEIKVPENSSELTRVSEAPVNKPDQPNDGHIAVDMLGQEVTPSGDGNASAGESQGQQSNPQSPRNPQELRERTRQMRQVSNTGQRVIADSIGANFPLGAVNELPNGLIEPTNYTSVFQVRNRGVNYKDTAHGTAYLVAHALDLNEDRTALSGIAPGNFFFDAVNNKVKIKPGDIMTVGGVKFRFVESHRAGKGLIARDKEIWDEKKPNRLVFITCYSSSNDNILFTFEKV